MRAKELMIGDWVLKLCKGGHYIPVKVLGVIDDVVDCQSRDGKRCSIGEAGIKSIPLTPEILEKSGFVYSDIPFWQSWQQFGLSIYGTTENYHINCGINVSMNVSNVHELQHALKICGVKKEIEL